MTGIRTGCIIVAFTVVMACTETPPKSKTLFTEVSASHSAIHFANELNEDDDFNIIGYLYFYNGGGVALGDINNDGLTDIYFSSNQGANRLYLNQGNFVFRDITESAGVQGVGNWKTGVAMADVNGDGLLDIFSCGVGGYRNFTGRNQLLINNGDLTFSDQTKAYGLDFQGFSTQAAFFDYDNDGDLDLYLLNHSVHSVRSYGDVSYRLQSDVRSGDKLYRSELIPSGETRFTEVTTQAGIFNSPVGYGLGVGIADFNNDGFADIYVSNDFHENDYLYLNQRDGTFKQVLEESMPHTSRFSMGNDIADINCDGWQDIITLDMLPRAEEIIKASAGEDPYEIVEFKLRFGYHYQVSRNALQWNRGLTPDGKLAFSDIAPMAGVEATDWSWAPLMADFDLDGWPDLFVANGIVRRPNDLDYIHYISTDSAQRFYSDKQMIGQMPPGKMPNYFFRNRGDLTFKNVSTAWLGAKPTFTTGAAYADLDNDGDLDLVLNNINEKASVLRNETQENNFLTIKLNGQFPNRLGTGCKVIAYAGGRQLIREAFSTRGWQSSVDPPLSIGLGGNDQVDSLFVIWPGGKYQHLKNVKANQSITLHQGDATSEWKYFTADFSAWLQHLPDMDFLHREDTVVVFESERLIPRALSTQGPKLAVADVNGDGWEDVFVGGASGQAGEIHLQDKSGNFRKSVQKSLAEDAQAEDTHAIFFFANNDLHPDLLVVSGGQSNTSKENLRPRLYFNDGKGNFRKSPDAFPEIFLNAGGVAATDADGDGDMDLFIGGRVITGHYGKTPESYLLMNDGSGHFTDVTASHLPKTEIGMVTAALWNDFNRDGKPDLIIAGEWMPLTVLIQNENGKFSNETSSFGFDNTHGWWNTLHLADVDGDGDTDILAGNAGLNTRLRASTREPVELWITDLDNNGSLDPILTYYNDHERFPFVSKDQLIKQVPAFKKKYVRYDDFKKARLEDLIPKEMQKETIHRKAEMFESIWIENDNGKWSIHPLPSEAQLFPAFGFLVEDINNDSLPDIVLAGNWHAVQPDIGRSDAGLGCVLTGDGKGNFIAVSPGRSGFWVPGEARDIKLINGATGEKRILVSRNNDSVLVFKLLRL
jgi:enediyne biosynthesis protein E4